MKTSNTRLLHSTKKSIPKYAVNYETNVEGFILWVFAFWIRFLIFWMIRLHLKKKRNGSKSAYFQGLRKETTIVLKPQGFETQWWFQWQTPPLLIQFRGSKSIKWRGVNILFEGDIPFSTVIIAQSTPLCKPFLHISKTFL